jgi:hypothetical protein
MFFITDKDTYRRAAIATIRIETGLPDCSPRYTMKFRPTLRVSSAYSESSLKASLPLLPSERDGEPRDEYRMTEADSLRQLVYGMRRTRYSCQPPFENCGQVLLSEVRIRALSMHESRSSPATGLLRKHTAPASMARDCVSLSGKAVTKMIGMLKPASRILLCRCRPDIPVSSTSVIRHHVFFMSADCRKASAEKNAPAANPCDFRNATMASQTDTSSSTQAMRETLDNHTLPIFLLRRRRTGRAFNWRLVRAISTLG